MNFYHNLEGGLIAQQRPPPPGASEPYPNLATIPARPPAPDITTEQHVADQLAAERDATQRAATASPLVVQPTATATAAPPKPAIPDPDANHVVVDAAPAPPPLPPAPPPAAAAIDTVPAVPAVISSGPLPVFAATPPTPPGGLGLDVPALPPPTPDVTAPVAPPAPANAVAVAFTLGSATLPPSATLNLRRFALAHKGVPLTVTGHGEAAGHTPDVQAAALQLALRRAQAMAASLAAAGVPAVNLRLHADATGTGGIATL